MSDIISTNSGKAADEAPAEAALQGEPLAKKHDLPAKERRLGVALVGLGKYSSEQLAPALTETEYCYLAGVVSGTPEKRESWRIQYGLKEQNIYSYDDFDRIGANRDIDILYIVLPNAMHADFVMRAARAGKHVICEKPMATNIEDCRRMIEACNNARVKLSIGYRLHFDPFNEKMMQLGRDQVFGPVNKIVAANCMEVGGRDQWRLDHSLAGGGPLMDVGIYCVQAALYTTGELPVSVSAKFHEKSDRRKFDSVEEGIEWEFTFPGGATAYCECSYSKERSMLRAEARTGWFELEPAYAYNGLQGRTSEGPMMITPLNQQAAQMDDFARCVQNASETPVPGEMGLRDVKILESIYESANSRKTVKLDLKEFDKTPGK